MKTLFCLLFTSLCLIATGQGLGEDKTGVLKKLDERDYRIIYKHPDMETYILEKRTGIQRCFVVFDAEICTHIGYDYTDTEFKELHPYLKEKGFVIYMEDSFFCMGSIGYWEGKETKTKAMFLASPEYPDTIIILLAASLACEYHTSALWGVIFIKTDE